MTSIKSKWYILRDCRRNEVWQLLANSLEDSQFHNGWNSPSKCLVNLYRTLLSYFNSSLNIHFLKLFHGELFKRHSTIFLFSISRLLSLWDLLHPSNVSHLTTCTKWFIAGSKIGINIIHVAQYLIHDRIGDNINKTYFIITYVVWITWILFVFCYLLILKVHIG